MDLVAAGSGSNSITIYMNMMTSNVMSARSYWRGPLSLSTNIRTVSTMERMCSIIIGTRRNLANRGTQTTGCGIVWRSAPTRVTARRQTMHPRTTDCPYHIPPGMRTMTSSGHRPSQRLPLLIGMGPHQRLPHILALSRQTIMVGSDLDLETTGGDVGEVPQTGLCYPGGSDGCAASTAITFYTIAAGTGGSATAFTASRGVWSTILSGGSLYQQFNYSTALTKSGVSASEAEIGSAMVMSSAWNLCDPVGQNQELSSERRHAFTRCQFWWADSSNVNA